jgi:transposase
MIMSSLPVSLPDNPVALKAMVVALQARNAQLSTTIRVYDQLIQSLQLRIAKLKKRICSPPPLDRASDLR